MPNRLTKGRALVGALEVNGVLKVTPQTALTYAASGTTNLDPTLGTFFTVTTATGNSNIALTAVPKAGHLFILIINNDAGGARTITFTTNFRATGTVVGTASKACVVGFISDGTNAIEIFRAGAAGGTAGA